jgi:periplasmic protein TonB
VARRNFWNDSILGGVMLSMAVHAIPVGKSFMNMYETRAFVIEARDIVHEYLWSQYDVEIEPEKEKEKPPEPEKEEPPPEPDAPAPILNTPPPKATPQPEEKKAPAPPPEAAQAGQVLTAKEDPTAPADFTDFTMVQGDAGTYAGGVTDSKGTGKDAVYDKYAKGGGVDGGTGTGPATTAQPAAQGPDLSKPASPASRDWNCSHLFPPEADEADVNQATVSVIVTVGQDGSPRSVKVVSDPGNGFGRAARTCALSQRYKAALDREGNATVGATPPFTVRFTR